MFATQKNISDKKPDTDAGAVCNRYLFYPDETGKRQAEGGLRLRGQYKQPLPDKPLISVVTVVYNNEKTLERCIRSVLEQTYDNIEYIVIDGGSSDGTLDIIEKYQDAIDYFVSEPDGGIYYAMNKGIALARGDYIALLNSDDWYEQDPFSGIPDLYKIQPNKIISCHERTLNDNYKVVLIRKLKFFDERVFLRMPMSHPGSFIPKTVYNKVGYYNVDDYKLISDWEFLIRCYRKDIEVVEYSKIVVNYWRTGATSFSNYTIYNEQIKLLSSNFLSIKSYDILYLLSSKMEETSIDKITDTIARNVKKGDMIPEILLKAIYKYKKPSENFEVWKSQFKSNPYKNKIDSLIKLGISQKLDKKSIWLINERGWDAQDNGFAFYVYIKKEHPEINAYYVISKDSSDFDKVNTIDSDTIIEYQSEEHKLYYVFSNFVISSQGGEHCHPLDYTYLKSNHADVFRSKYIFLQHGVLKNFIHYFQKGAFHNALFVISGEMERRLMVNEYQYTSWDLAETGLSRYDTLENRENSKKPFIFFMPTWRGNIKSEADFLSSDYYKILQELFNNDVLIDLLEKYNTKIKFLIHPNFADYASLFHVKTGYIEILPKTSDISLLIRQCSFAITDYSSFIFDVAKQKKNIIYFQYDYKQFRESHYKESPVFSYKKHGLGPVVENEAELIDEIDRMLRDREDALAPYIQRRDYIFKYDDKNASERIFHSICKYDDLASELIEIYKNNAMQKIGIFDVFIKDDTLLLFLKVPNKYGAIVEPFTINYHLLGDSTRSQKVNLALASYIIHIDDRPVYAFYTKIPKLSYKLEIYKEYIYLKFPILNYADENNINVAIPLYTVRGGAGIAAKRLHEGLLEQGVNSVVFEKENSHNKHPAVYYDKSNKTNSLLSNRNNAKNIYAGNTIFTIIPSYSKLSDYDFLLNFDIVNLHWIANYLPTEAIAYLSHSNKHIVWTFHDMNPLSGGCHYFHGCDQWKSDCMNCPQLIDNYDNYPAKILAAKKKYFNFENITVVALSNHSKRILEKSIYKDCRIEVIPNSIEIDIFKPSDKTVAKKVFNLPENKKIIFFAPSYNSSIKGINELNQVLDLLIDKVDKYHLLLAGSGSMSFRNDNFGITRLGNIDDNNRLALAYSAADITIVPSLEETFSNTTAESISCGTPVVGFKIAALPDMIKDDYNGYTVELGDIKGLADSICKVLEGPDLSENCRKYAEENLKLDIQAKRYKALYEDLLSNPVEETGLAETIPEVFPETAATVIRLLNDVVSEVNLEVGTLTNDRWYRFGQMSRKRKIWTIGKEVSKKMKIHRTLKPFADVLKEMYRKRK